MVKVTVKEVAKEAGVSTATVSRVINGHYPVSEECRARVGKAIEKLNYTPNAVARSLKVKKTNIIGLVVPDISNPYFAKMAKGIEYIISKEGYSLLMGSTHDMIENELDLINLLSERRVEAIILASCQKDKSNIEELINRGMNVIMVDRNIENLKSISIVLDNFEASYRITNMLIENGHKKIGIINGNPDVSTEKERFYGFKKAMKDNNLDIYEGFVSRNNFSMEEACKSIINIVENSKELPSAMFCTNHYLAEGVLLGLKNCKMKVPENISLICFGELSVPKLIKPRITTVSYDSYTMGKKCGEIVLNKINSNFNKEDCREYIITTEIIEGDSIKIKK